MPVPVIVNRLPLRESVVELALVVSVATQTALPTTGMLEQEVPKVQVPLLAVAVTLVEARVVVPVVTFKVLLKVVEPLKVMPPAAPLPPTNLTELLLALLPIVIVALPLPLGVPAPMLMVWVPVLLELPMVMVLVAVEVPMAIAAVCEALPKVIILLATPVRVMLPADCIVTAVAAEVLPSSREVAVEVPMFRAEEASKSKFPAAACKDKAASLLTLVALRVKAAKAGIAKAARLNAPAIEATHFKILNIFSPFPGTCFARKFLNFKFYFKKKKGK